MFIFKIYFRQQYDFLYVSKSVANTNSKQHVLLIDRDKEEPLIQQNIHKSSHDGLQKLHNINLTLSRSQDFPGWEWSSRNLLFSPQTLNSSNNDHHNITILIAISITIITIMIIIITIDNIITVIWKLSLSWRDKSKMVKLVCSI